MQQTTSLIAVLARYCLVGLLAIWQLPGLAQAWPLRDHTDHITARAWLDDPYSSLGPEQVRSMGWTSYTGPLKRGFTASTTWLRLRIEPLPDEDLHDADWQHQLVLRIQPGHLDEIALFDPRHPELAPTLAGDMHDWRLSEYRSFNQNLVIAAPREPMEVLLRLRTQSNHGIHVEALHRDDAEAFDRQQQLAMGAVIAFLMMVLAWAITAWLEGRERVIGAFIVHQVVSILFALSLFGFTRVYLSDWLSALAIDRMTSVLFPITASAVLWFHWHFLREFKPPPLSMRCLLLLSVAPLLLVPMMLTGLTRQALQINAAIVVLNPALLLLMAWLSSSPTPQDAPRPARRQLIVNYSLMLTVLWAAAMPALGWLPSPHWATYSAIFYGFISAAILFGALRSRAAYAASNRSKTLTDLATAEILVLQERKLRREQEQFMIMLSHELTTALSTAHLAIGRLTPESPMRGRGYRAIVSMRAIIERCRLSGEFETTDATPKLAAVNIPELLHELCEQIPCGTSIVVNTDPGLPECATDRQLLGVILGNLLDNALKYGGNASPVEVTASAQPRGALAGLQLSVVNAPSDVGRPDPEQIFRKYWRGQGATCCAGSGLGLYLSSMIADRLGGELRYQPNLSNVRFELWLPI